MEFSENALRVLAINGSGEITFKNETDLGFNMNEDYLNSSRDEITNIFTDKIAELFKDEEFRESRASILIDTSQAFMNVFPLDFQEDQGTINSHIFWELSNYFPNNYKEFNVKYYRLNNKYLNDGIDEVLLIAVDKNKIDFIKNLCNSSGIKIKSVDIDQFVVERCIKKIYPAEMSESALIIGCKSNRLDFSLISGARIKYYDYENTGTTNINALLVKQMNFFIPEFEHHSGKVFLYGDRNGEIVRNFLNKEFENLSVTFIDPFSKKYSKENQSRYSPLYGLALKSLSS